jgi:SagB-type dehydrogenase family enzyme
MKKISLLFLILFFSFSSLITMAQDIRLPAPDKKGGKPLMQALSERKSVRSFSKSNISQQQLSDMLWAAWGYNRPEQKMRTAPSARNTQEIDIYVALPSGVYLYEPSGHILKEISKRDVRTLTGSQDFVGGAAVNLVYVADMTRAGKKVGEKITDADLLWPNANTGFIAQNVYLYCASANLGTVVRGMIPKDKLAPALGLKAHQIIILAQTVGIPDN